MAEPKKVKKALKVAPAPVKVSAKKIAPKPVEAKGKKKNTAVTVDDIENAAGGGVSLVYGQAKFTPNAQYALRGQNMDRVTPLDLAEFSERALQEYGSYVVEERAVPDFRDGLKPVHRSLLWALCDLGLRPSGPFKKSAQTVGRTTGMYHPHGDASVYEAMVTIANTIPPLVAGQGNWGTPVDSAAAPRYTESRMSKFAHMFLLDREYLEVVPRIPNYSNDAEIPLYMPALLPYLMFNGSVPVPAYGVSTGIPTFAFEPVAKVVMDMLNGKEYSLKKLADTLKIEHEYGCRDITSAEEYSNLIGTGRGRVTYEPQMKVDVKKRIIHIRTFVPGGYSSTKVINSAHLKLVSNIDGISKAYSDCGRSNKLSGPWGAQYNVKCGRVSEERLYEIAERVQRELTKSITYRLGVTIRRVGKSNAFRYMDFLTYLKGWVAYRVALEERVNTRRIEKAEREKHVQEVYLFAVDNIDKLSKVLPKVLTSSDPDKTLAKAMDMPVDDARIILDRQVRKLAKLERADLVAKIKELKAQIKQFKWNLENPGEAAAADTDLRVKAYLKSPDPHVYAGKEHTIFAYREGGTMYGRDEKKARKSKKAQK